MEKQVEGGLTEQAAAGAPSTGLLFRTEQVPMTGRDRSRVDLGCVVLAVLAVATVAVGLTGPVRWVLVGAAILLVPGAAIAPLFRIRDAWAYAALAIVFSLAVSTVGATLTVWLNWFHPLALGAALAVASCVALLLDFRRVHHIEGVVA